MAYSSMSADLDIAIQSISVEEGSALIASIVLMQTQSTVCDENAKVKSLIEDVRH